MKPNGRTLLSLTTVLAVPLLASGLAFRGRQSDSAGTRSKPGELSSPASEDSTNRPPPIPVATSTPSTRLQFEVFKVENRKSITQLESRLGADAFTAMLKLNRIDIKHIRVGDSLVIPNESGDPMTTAPFPIQLEVARNIPKLVLVSRRVQAFGAYESGKLVRWGPTSTGKKSTPTPAGLYHANWKAKVRRSSVNQSWILPWCFNLDDNAGISFHQFDLPGYPASHGCVRLLEEDAKWIYEWVEQWTLSKIDNSILAFGTPVVIFGDYNYGEKPVWKRLADDPSATAISIDETESALNRHLATIEAKARAGRPATTEQTSTIAAATNQVR